MSNNHSTPERILIVEDEENARKGYEALLRKWDCEVLGVGSGEEALAKFPEFAPRVILADVELPGMNGLELLRQLGDEILQHPGDHHHRPRQRRTRPCRPSKPARSGTSKNR